MKHLFICLSFCMSLTAFAESPVQVEPILLEALYAQSGAIKIDESGTTLARVLGEAMGYPEMSGTEIKVTHSCEYDIARVWNCTLNVNSTDTYDGVTTESSVLIRYEADWKLDASQPKIKNVRVDYAG